MSQEKNSHTDFAQLFELYRKPYVQFAHSYLRNMDDAEDVYMDVIVHFWENRGRLPADLHVPSYLLTAVKNRSLNHLRNQQTRVGIHERLQDHGIRELNFRIASLEECDPVELFSDEIKQIISETMKKMPEQTRQIFLLSRYDNRTNREIAEKLNLNIKTVEYHISKSLKELRVRLKDYLPLILAGLFQDLENFF